MRRFFLVLLLVLAPLLVFAGEYATTVFPTFTGDISSETTVATAATGTHLTVQSAIATVTTAGVVVFKDGTAGTTVANVYLASNTPTVLGPSVWGAHGLTLAHANLTGTLSGSTLTILFRCGQQ
jgi:hypothetical protein